jgi:YHS domain-containing protein
MRNLILMLGVVLMFAGPAWAVQPGQPADVEAQSGVVVAVNNKTCPVSGARISSDSGMAPATYEYKGKLYRLCCPGCIGAFSKNPEKYSGIADKETSVSAEQKGQ